MAMLSIRKVPRLWESQPSGGGPAVIHEKLMLGE